MVDKSFSRRGLITNSLLVGGSLAVASIPAVVNAQTNVTIVTVDKFSDLQYTAATVGQVIKIKGHTTAGIGGGSFIAKSGTVTNNGGTKTPSASPNLYWERENYTLANAADFGMAGNHSAAANKSALLAAMAVFRAVYIPGGAYNIDGDINVRHVSQQIYGESIASAYNTPSPATVLNFSSGTVGFDLTTTFQEPGDSENSSIKNLMLDGKGNVDTLIKFAGTKFFQGLHLQNFRSNGFWGVDLLNSSVIESCSVFNYESRGAAWGHSSRFCGIGALFEGTQSTAFFIKSSRFRCCQYGMVLRASQGSTFSDSVFESNSGMGILMEASNGNGLIRNKFQNCWLENNSEYAPDQNYYQLSINNFATVPQYSASNNVFDSCNFSVPATAHQRAIKIENNIIGTKFDNCYFGGNDGHSIVVNSSPANGTQFIDCRGVVETNYAGHSWNNINVKQLGGSLLKRTVDNRDVQSLGDSAKTFTIDNGKAMAITLDSNSFAVMVSIYCANTGHGALFFATPHVSNKISDTAASFSSSSAPPVGQVGVYTDGSAKVYIKNNSGNQRILALNFIGARINATADPV